VKILFDTSLLVAATVAAHPAHSRALPWLSRAHAGDFELVVSAHTLAEMYAVLTRLPLSPRIRPAMAEKLISENVRAHAEVVSLSAKDYSTVLSNAAALNLSGGVVYDAVIAHAARKSSVDQLVTLDPDDFRRVWPDAGDRIIAA